MIMSLLGGSVQAVIFLTFKLQRKTTANPIYIFRPFGKNISSKNNFYG